jgi:hypothetical protein
VSGLAGLSGVGAVSILSRICTLTPFMWVRRGFCFRKGMAERKEREGKNEEGFPSLSEPRTGAESLIFAPQRLERRRDLILNVCSLGSSGTWGRRRR